LTEDRNRWHELIRTRLPLTEAACFVYQDETYLYGGFSGSADSPMLFKFNPGMRHAL
jgi:hypothetical protein